MNDSDDLDIEIPKRSKRRHHIERLKKKRKDYWFGDLDTVQKNKVLSTPHPCSKSCCGNPRRSKGVYEHKLTVQERKENQLEEGY